MLKRWRRSRILRERGELEVGTEVVSLLWVDEQRRTLEVAGEDSLLLLLEDSTTWEWDGEREERVEGVG